MRQESPMIDHTAFSVRDYAASRSFYARTLAPLGYSMLMEFGTTAGFGNTHPDFWIESADDGDGTHNIHVAFKAETRQAVDEFYRAALAAGGADNGPPGLREDYGPDYYAAYVIDPDGNNVEAVCHGRPTKSS
jgi:catechol 2,3-dioxygenase-like lactoylglutathione lyase family enzyme